MKFRLKLEEYDYQIVHKPGKFNTNADALSRIPDNGATTVNVLTRSQTTDLNYDNFVNDLNVQIIPNANVADTDKPMKNADSHLTRVYFIAMNKNFHNTSIIESAVQERLKSETLTTTDPFHFTVSGIHYVCVPTQDTMTDEDLFVSIKTLNHYLIENKLSSTAIPNFAKYSPYMRFKIDRIRSMFRYIFRNSDGGVTIFHGNISNVTSEQEKLEIFKEFHSNPLGGHQGISKTYKKIRRL